MTEVLEALNLISLPGGGLSRRSSWSVLAFESIADAIAGADFSALSRRSPALTADWRSYLRCSIARMVMQSRPPSSRCRLRGDCSTGSHSSNFA
jgi:hypothetical protein